ncbi:hypothetical protein PSACC_01914 [Paramicrosporidium saccamoebae]|uniref:Calponin-homology (CH) domain-containing protein n=1 Tax=Paramicrosporidium saccamoebae TaxID=1246581 RepID=A0A2H9TKH1_9FUNG|nr:hypothetical protein PSACC_01914 [Paramicrosporidium saccamoebae]
MEWCSGTQCQCEVTKSSKLINVLAPGSIPTRLIRDCNDERRRYFLMLENQTLVLKAARRLNCSLVNIAPSDLVEGKVVKNGMVIKLAIEYPKPLSRDSASYEIKADNELAAEHALLRWINSTLATPNDLVTDFKDCLKDCRQYGRLLNTLFPTMIDIEEFTNQNPFQRAPLIVSAGKSILGNKCILEVNDILKGNETMNVLFLATLCRHVAEEMCQTGSISCQSSFDALIPVENTAELEAKIAALMEENAALRQKVSDMQAALEESDITKVPLEAIKVCHDEQTKKTEATENVLEYYDESIRNACMDDSVALRYIYLRAKDLLPLVALLYPDHSAPSLTNSCTISGHLTKKSVWGSRWNSRYAIIKDNFILFYKDEHTAKPTSVEKLDDCLVRRMDGICAKFKEPVLCVEVCSKVNPHYFYISAKESVLDVWKDHITKVSSWWVSRS